MFAMCHCSSAQKTVAPAPPPPKTESTAPTGPTRTDFKTIARKLVSRCVGGGWISRWRADHENVDVAKPKIHLEKFEDRTDQNLDPQYLHSTLEQRMRLSGVYDMVAKEQDPDFLGRGHILRLAERDARGTRFSVYTAVLQLVEPTSGGTTYSCEASVRGEM